MNLSDTHQPNFSHHKTQFYLQATDFCLKVPTAAFCCKMREIIKIYQKISQKISFQKS